MLEIRRGTNPLLRFQLPDAVALSALAVTFRQAQKNVLEKVLEDVTYDADSGVVEVSLSQEDTLALADKAPVWVQLRLRDEYGAVVASEPVRIGVRGIYKEGVI